MSNYDTVFAAYIFKAFMEIHRQSPVYLKDTGGELETMSALWELAIEASRCLDSAVHPEFYDYGGVFAYDYLDDTSLAEMLIEHGLFGVRLWCVAKGVKTR